MYDDLGLTYGSTPKGDVPTDGSKRSVGGV